MKQLKQFKKLPDWVQKSIVFLTAVAAFVIAVRQNPYLYGTIIGLLIWLALLFWSLSRYRERFKYHPKKQSKHGKRNLIGKYVLNKEFFWVLTLLIFASCLIITPSTNTFIQIGLGRKSPPEFSPAQHNQEMIIVADFEDKSAGKVSGFDLSGRIYRSLTDKIGENNLGFPLENYHHPVNSQDEAEKILSDYNAMAIIWGSYDAAGGRLHITYYSQGHGLNLCSVETEKSDFGYATSNVDEIQFTLAEQLPTIASYTTLVTLGKIHLTLLPDPELARKFVNDAIDVTTKNNGPFPADALFYRSALYDQIDHRSDLALADLERILHANPDYFQAYIQIGNIYVNQGKEDLAKETFNKLVSLAPNYFCAYIERGRFYMDTEMQFDLAEQDFNQAIKLDSNSPKGYSNLGTLYTYEKKYDEAISNFQKAIELDPNEAENYCWLGADLTQKGRFDEATSNVKQGIQHINIYDDPEIEKTCQGIKTAAENRIVITIAHPLSDK